MITIIKQQARQRFTVLPPRLQDAMFSEQNAEVIAGIAAQNHLNDERARKIAEVAGWVLLGFIHPEDAANELQECLGIASQVASQISSLLDNKIFKPLRDDLDRVYAPLPHETPPEAPKIIEEIKKTAEAGAGGISVPRPPAMGEFDRVAVSGAPKPTSAAPEPPVVSRAEPPLVKFGATPTPPQTKPAPPAHKAEQPVVSNVEPPPTIIHEETKAKPTASASEFHVEVPIPKFSDAKRGGAPLKSAVLELGLAREPKPSASPPQPTPTVSKAAPPPGAAPAGTAGSSPEAVAGKARVVHYSEFKTPLQKPAESKTVPATSEHEIKEITEIHPPTGPVKPPDIFKKIPPAPTMPLVQPPSKIAEGSKPPPIVPAPTIPAPPAQRPKETPPPFVPPAPTKPEHPKN